MSRWYWLTQQCALMPRRKGLLCPTSEEWASLRDVDFWAWFEAKALCDCDILISVCKLTDSKTYTVLELAFSWGPVQIGPGVAVEVTICEYGGCGGSTVHFSSDVS